MSEVLFCYLVAGLVCTLCHIEHDCWKWESDDFCVKIIIMLFSTLFWCVWILGWIAYKCSRKEDAQ